MSRTSSDGTACSLTVGSNPEVHRVRMQPYRQLGQLCTLANDCCIELNTVGPITPITQLMESIHLKTDESPVTVKNIHTILDL